MADTTVPLHANSTAGADVVPPGGYQFHVTGEHHVPNGTLLSS